MSETLRPSLLDTLPSDVSNRRERMTAPSSINVTISRRPKSPEQKLRVENEISILRRPPRPPPSIGTILAEYIHSALPTHLIYIPEMKLMDRAAIQKKVQANVEEIVRVVAQTQASWLDEVRFAARKVLAYTIFSHRWSDDGEPTFVDVSAPPQRWALGRRRAGFRKLEKFCAVAQTFDCSWAWSDTCCIDKSSSSELDEAIRSMYRWYRDAAVCVVHLSETRSTRDMANDVWFTRGWTLQELLAPQRIKFYNKHWEPLTQIFSDKMPGPGGILDALSSITGIPNNDLWQFKPGPSDIRRKMSWAAGRRTTRIEDVAYSLIGIFDVNLVVAYGEGERAFYRLQLAIMEKTSALELLVWHGEASDDNSAIARSPQCYASIAPLQGDDLPAEVWVRRGRKNKRDTDTDADMWDKLDLKNLLSYGGTSFSVANTGLRVELILYDIFILPEQLARLYEPLLSNTDAPSASALWQVGRITTDCVAWRSRVTGQADLTLELVPRESRPTSPIAHFRYTLGVLDAEWSDAHAKPESYRRALPGRISDSADTPPRHELTGNVEELVKKAVRGRAYTVLFLREEATHSGEVRCFSRDRVSSDVMHVKRPKGGWGKPESVFIV